jgi:hypothetical protein
VFVAEEQRDVVGQASGASQALVVLASLPAEFFSTPWLLAVHLKPASAICFRKGADSAPSAGHKPAGALAETAGVAFLGLGNMLGHPCPATRIFRGGGQGQSGQASRAN